MLTKEQIARLLDIANAGCHKGMVEESRAIYEGILAVKPGHVPALIGQAFSNIVIGEYAEAEEKLAAIIAQHPEDDDAKAMLGLSFFLEGKKDKAKERLASVQEGDGGAAKLAASLMEQMD